MRYEEQGVCKECFQFSAHCKNAKQCNPVRKKLRPYDGIRLTADGFDCALPVTIDSHSSCSFGCLYCFSDNLMGHYCNTKEVGQTSLKRIENIFSGSEGKDNDIFREALRYDKKKNGFPCAVQLGGVCDAGDNIERNQGWLLKFIDLAIKYNQPVRMSTKGNLFLTDEYLSAMAKAPYLFWVAFSLITPDDELLKKIDIGAPTATERLESMRRLNAIGVKTSLRFRPMFPGISDSTPKIKNAYKVLLNKAADCGTKAVSAEVGFMPYLRKPNDLKWAYLEKVSKTPLIKIYKSFGIQACTRAPYQWTEEIIHRVVETAHANGMTVGISDPVWKQLGDSGCCCGILPDDPVFGNWEVENATNALLQSKKDGREIYLKDITPSWAYKVLFSKMCASGAGPLTKYKRDFFTWADKLKEGWNKPTSQRSPMNYFQGALEICGEDGEGNYIYKYKGLERQYKKTHWKFYDS